MSTVPQTPSAWRSQEMRVGWQKAGDFTTNTISHIFRFFTTYPPLAQGLYYLLIGLWPLVGIGSYQVATGHNPAPPWLAQAIGVLLLVDSAVLCLAAYRRQGSPEVLVLAFGTALGLTAVDVHLVWRGYSAIYLVDAALQLGLVAFWVYGWRKATNAASAVAGAPVSPTTVSSLTSPTAAS